MSTTAKSQLQPIDKLAIAIILLLSMAIALLVWGNNSCHSNRHCWFHTGAKVAEFSWQDRTIGREDRAFILTFNRPMNRDSVADNLKIQPPLPGKISWSGSRMAYTLNSPAPYGETYQISLDRALEQFAAGDRLGETIRPFTANFRTRDRAFIYISSKPESNGRLVLYNWTQQTETILTPDNLVVFDFKTYPKGDLVLFSAADRHSGNDAIRTLQLYTVTTGLNNETKSIYEPELELILDNRQYQNNKFDLARDGNKIIVQRLDRKNPANFGLWLLEEDRKPQLLDAEAGGDFLITPDSQTVAVAKGEGIALLSLQPNTKPIDFLPKFGRILAFTADGTGVATINYNTDNAKLRYTQSLYYLNNAGVEKELLNLEGSIVDCQFSPTGAQLYCLLTELEVKGQEYREKPYLAEIELATAKVLPLFSLPEYQDIKLSMAPDGLGILFAQVLTDNDTATVEGNLPSGATVVKSRVWLLIPPIDRSTKSSVHQVEELPFIGYLPQWVP
jgi:hypothetical protein